MASRKTLPVQARVAVVFDFDDTLAWDTTSTLVESLGIEREAFWSRRVRPRVREGWDPIPAAFRALVELSRERGPITRERFVDFGERLALVPGVEAMFERVTAAARQANPDVEVEFYVVSSGIGEIVRHTRIASRFRRIWACDLEYGEDGGIAFPRRIVSHTEKTRYLHRISKGIFDETDERLFEAELEVSDQELHVPLDQMVYVGDGMTDIACFSLLADAGGIGVGVVEPRAEGKWGEWRSFSRGSRVANLAKADYREDAELLRSLCLSVEALGRLVALRQMSRGE